MTVSSAVRHKETSGPAFNIREGGGGFECTV